MRFFPDGPSIPDELLTARDEGRVVFFCGAGVSRAKAGLANFFGLAEAVLKSLGVGEDDPAGRILREAKEIEVRTGTGLISADRVFGLLERDFPTRDIERAVANALRPAVDVDLHAHRILLDLATTPDNKVRLVTTNFDRLFEQCRSDMRVAMHPRLPDPARNGEMDCIVHLHGRVTGEYDGSEGDGFVLSSSEFGRAYLSDGWATRFFREVLDRYVVVFVGYTADDPPVQYLLEALNRTEGRPRSVYAFQFGNEGDVAGKWHHKGVEAIAYSEADNHKTLWDTLQAWSERAKDPEAWQKGLIRRAAAGPRSLQPHERGQVAHLISTLEGARVFAQAEPPAPAEWLCVFDPYRRYASPSRQHSGEEAPVDPFDLYAIDSDLFPMRTEDGGREYNETLLKSAWDGFAATRIDSLNLREGSLASFRGSRAAHASRLPPRIEHLGQWLSRVSHQATAPWWAAFQMGLHPNVQSMVKHALDQSVSLDLTSKLVRKAWWYLFDSWGEEPEPFRRDWYELRQIISKDGWSDAHLRRYGETIRPYLTTQAKSWRPLPPVESEELRLHDLFSIDVTYPSLDQDVAVPNEFLARFLRERRKNLQAAVSLEAEVGGYGLENLEPIENDIDNDHDRHSRSSGLNGHVLAFSRSFASLVEFDLAAARREYAAWPIDDPWVFGKLRIWAAGKTELVSDHDFGQVIASLDQATFWATASQRDLLLVLSRRWDAIEITARSAIETRLIEGRDPFDEEDSEEYLSRKAWASLNRIHWLASNGCSFSFDLEEVTQRLSSMAPSWEPRNASHAADHMGARGGTVRTDTDHSLLLSAPLSDVLRIASENAGRTEDFLVENDPFLGLSQTAPVRAFRVLVSEAKSQSFPEWAWRTFFRADRDRQENPRLKAAIAARLVTLPSSVLLSLSRPISDWMSSGKAELAAISPTYYQTLVTKLTEALSQDPDLGRSGIVRSSKAPDWTMEAINSAPGNIAQSLMRAPQTDGVTKETGFQRTWLSKVEALLTLPDDLRRYSLVIFCFNLSWFYSVDPEWTELHLLAAIESHDSDDRNAAWSGFLWGVGRLPSAQLYARLSRSIIEEASSDSLPRRGHGEALAALTLGGWLGTDPDDHKLISDEEMRSALLRGSEEFRLQVLWQLNRWASDEEKGDFWCEKKVSFLQKVWPRQKSVKTPKVSARLSDVAFSSADCFPKVADAVLPLLTTAEHTHLFLPELRKAKDTVVDLYPREVIAILHAILPEEVALWPWGIDEILQRLIERVGHPVRDEKLAELKRRWESR